MERQPSPSTALFPISMQAPCPCCPALCLTLVSALLDQRRQAWLGSHFGQPCRWHIEAGNGKGEGHPQAQLNVTC